MDKPKIPTKLQLSVDPRIVILILVGIIVAMLIAWHPWESTATANSRSVQVTGEAKLTAAPDEYAFYPSYTFKNADKQAALDEANKKNNEVVAKLKSLGVADNKIKTSTSAYDDKMYLVAPDTTDATPTYTLGLTITVNSKELAQKVQDYLNTTSPSGSVSPQATFSDTKRKQLESQARDAATKDARNKAEQNARNLGFKIGKVKQVMDGQGFNIMTLEDGRGAMTMSADSKAIASPTIQAGENELNYTVTVTYYLK